MRICYFADGRYLHAERSMRFFVERGHEVHLISFAEVSAERVAELEKIGIKYHGATGSFHFKRFWLTLEDLRFVKRVLREHEIDILHSQFLAENIWYGALSGFHPHVVTAIGGDVVGENWKPSGSLQEKILTPFALKRADAVTAWGPVLAERLRPYVGDGVEIEIMHGGVDLTRFSPGPKQDKLRRGLNIPENGNVVFSPRLIRPLYNIDTIAHAAGLVCERVPDTYFVMAFPAHILDSSYAERVKQIFAGGAAAARVRFVPSIRHEEMADYFRLADVSVSIPDTDGLGLAILESMACGTPTVIGDLPDYDRGYFEHEKTTLMADVKDPRAVAEAIIRLLSDADLAGRITGEARFRVEKTAGYEYQMSRMEKVYERLVK